MSKRKQYSVDVSLGQNLVELRKKCGLTQQAVADNLGINRSTYTKYELGVSEPNIETMRELSALFNCDISELVSNRSSSGFNDSGSDIIVLDDSEKSVVLLYRKLNERKKIKLITIIGDLMREPD